MAERGESAAAGGVFREPFLRLADPLTLTLSEQLWGWTDEEIYGGFAAYLRHLGMTVEVEKVAQLPLQRPRGRWWHLRGDAVNWQIPGSIAVLRNQRTGRLAALDCGDAVDAHWPEVYSLLEDPRCLGMLKAQFSSEIQNASIYRNIHPWTYFEDRPRATQALADDLRTRQRSERRLYFRGAVHHNHRLQILKPLVASGIVNAEPDRRVDFEDFLEEMSRHLLALSLPGHGNLCHREIEAFALGTPVLMPQLKYRLHDPLIPDVHYFSVPVDIGKTPAEEVANALRQRYLEVIDDETRLTEVAAAAREWYERNVRVPRVFELTAELLGWMP